MLLIWLAGSDSGPAKYYGGEVRKETSGDHSYVMIAGESSSLLKKDVFTWGVLAKALGSQPQVKYGQGSSPLAKVSASIPDSNIVAVNIPHSDSGLFGIAILTHSHYSGQVCLHRWILTHTHTIIIIIYIIQCFDQLVLSSFMSIILGCRWSDEGY